MEREIYILHVLDFIVRVCRVGLCIFFFARFRNK